MKTLKMKILGASVLAGLAISQANAAVDAAVTTALTDAGTDSATIAVAVLVVLVGIAAIKYARRAL